MLWLLPGKPVPALSCAEVRRCPATVGKRSKRFQARIPTSAFHLELLRGKDGALMTSPI
jgi:hypothetical protein